MRVHGQVVVPPPVSLQLGRPRVVDAMDLGADAGVGPVRVQVVATVGGQDHGLSLRLREAGAPDQGGESLLRDRS